MAITSSFISKFLAKEAVSLARAGARSLIKTKAKETLANFKAKSPAEIEKEIDSDIGYFTTHYKVSKTQEIIYRPSAHFISEWLSNNPEMKGKLLKNEEDGRFFFDGQPLINSHKTKILETFIAQTGCQSTAMMGYLNAALNNLDPSDFTATKFQELFAGWKPENPSIIDCWLSNVFGENFTEDPTYATWLFKKWIIGAAKRITQPGISHDGCLTLRGRGGIGKTLFCRNLMPPPFENRTGEIYAPIKNPQKMVEAMIGKSIATFDELAILDQERTEEIFKQLISTQAVDVRLPWRRDPQRFNLRAAWAATTNRDRFITDQFLSRRLWIIELADASKFNLEWLKENREILWKEALYLANKGEPNFLTPEEQARVEEHNKKFLLEMKVS
jgi:Virulence-associated protein E-like domain